MHLGKYIWEYTPYTSQVAMQILGNLSTQEYRSRTQKRKQLQIKTQNESTK